MKNNFYDDPDLELNNLGIMEKNFKNILHKSQDLGTLKSIIDEIQKPFKKIKDISQNLNNIDNKITSTVNKYKYRNSILNNIQISSPEEKDIEVNIYKKNYFIIKT